MEHREFAIKCSGKNCKEVFHVSENYEPGGINDRGFIVVKCKKCDAVTKIKMKNPSKYGVFENFEIVDVCEDEDCSQCDSIPEEKKALVIGNEPPRGLPMAFVPNLQHPFWQDGETNLEETAMKNFLSNRGLITEELKGLYNVWVKSMPGFDNVERCVVSIKYEFEGQIYEAKWAKELTNDSTFCCKHFHLIEHTGSSMLIDGIYSRNEMMAYLFRCLMRWKMIANQVIVVTPFIGFDFPFSKEKDRTELITLWKLLNSLLDIDRTTFITRVKTYNSLKRCQKQFGIPADVLKEWGLMSNLQKMEDNPKTRIKTKAQFHTKFYAGVFDDHVELLSGSSNLQTGIVLEQMHLRNISRDLFKSKYLDQLVGGFVYNQSYNPNTLFISIEKEGEVMAKVGNLKRHEGEECTF